MNDITRQDMVLHRTERTTGGRLGPVEITGGLTDYLFAPITAIGRATGKVDFRGLYAWVSNDGTGQLLDAFLFVSQPPTDPNISVALMSRGAWGDGLADWTGYITSYLAAGARLPWFPLETTVKGSEVMMFWGRPEAVLPKIGGTYIVRGHPGQSNQQEQAVAITDTSVRNQSFYDPATQRDYIRQILTAYLDRGMQFDVQGPDVSQVTPANPSSVILDTNPSGGVRIYGISKVTHAVSIGDHVIHVDSVSTQVIPSAMDETNLVDQTAAGSAATLVPAAGGLIEFEYNDDLAEGVSLHLGTASVPGTVQIVSGPSTLTESGGQLKSGAVVVATVNSEDGIVSAVAGAPTYTGPLTIRFKPAGKLTAPRNSMEIPITVANRGRKYTAYLTPAPTPGTVQISYLVDGAWYHLYDNGDGTLTGASTELGQAQITGGNSVPMTLGYAPDVGSSVIVQWGVSAYTFNRAGTAVQGAAFLITTSQGFSAADTVTWHDGLDDRTATLGSDGTLTGDAEGTVAYGAKQIMLRPAILPPPGTVATVHITPKAQASEQFAGHATDSSKMFTLAHNDVVPGSVRVRVSGAALVSASPAFGAPNLANQDWTDDGAGALTGLGSSVVDYASGEVDLPLEFDKDVPQAIFGYSPANVWTFQGWSPTLSSTETYRVGLLTQVTISYLYGDDGAGTTETHTLTAALVDILPESVETVVGGSLRATFAGAALVERAGAIYADASVATGLGVWVGSLDYASRRATFTQWAGGAANEFTVEALTTRYGRELISSAVFAISGAPVKSQSLSVRAVQADGTEITATADALDTLAATGIEGTIHLDMGIARLRFGQWVTAAGNEGQPWYLPANVSGSQVWQPLPVYADALLYDCTTLQRAVLADAVIGVDTARIPGGRIDHVRKGDVVMLHHTDSLEVATPEAGAAVECGRELLERVWVKDATGADVPAVLTDTDAELDAGVVHWVDPLDLTGFTGPYTVHHRISDRGTVSDVDRINKTVTLRVASGVGGTSGTTHAYPSSGAYFSSLLYMGDMGVADSPEPWAQAQWGGVWSDSLIGSPADRAYDYLTYPIELTNKGSTLKAGVALVFESDGLHYRCYIEGIGIIDTGISIATDYAPINPVTGVPYFTIKGNTGGQEPWGAAPWPYLSCLRFQLQPSTYPAQAIRCVQPSAVASGTDHAVIEFGAGL
jgi:hypothetical protein